MSEQQKKYFYVDLIKVVAISLVILLHTAGIHLGEWNKVPYGIWMTENFYNAFTRMSVPLFVMSSGAMLLQKEERYYDFFKKRVMKILVPSIVWSGVYLVWRIVFTGENLGVKNMLKMVVTGSVYYHLWYLYMIVGLYLITPILRKITINATSKDLLYFSSLWIVFVSVCPTFLNVLKFKYNISLELGITIPLLSGHVGYYILGYGLNRWEPKKIHIYLSWIGVVAGWLLTAYGTLYFTSIANGFNDLFYSYFSPTVVLEAISCFTLLNYYGRILEKVISHRTKHIFAKLGNASFGVYLVHPLVRDLLLKNKLCFSVDSLAIHPILSNPLAAIELMILSYLIVGILLKVPIVNIAVGGRQAKYKEKQAVEMIIKS